MENKIKKIKVTKDSLISVATFNRDEVEVKNIRPAKFKVSSEGIFLKHKEVYEGFEWTDNLGIVRTCRKTRARTPYPDVYDLYTVSEGLPLTYLTPIQVKGDKIYNVPKITIHNLEAGENITHRLYFPEEDVEMYYVNVENLEELQSGKVDVIWLEYRV